MKNAAALCALGIDGERYLNSRDPVEVITLGEMARLAQEWESNREDRLANKIANAVGKLFSK